MSKTLETSEPRSKQEKRRPVPRKLTKDSPFTYIGRPGNDPTKNSRATGRVLYARVYDEETTYGNGG